MRTLLDRILAAPGWLLTNILLRFVPKSHLWHKRWFLFEDWRTRRTTLMHVVDVVLWEALLGIIVITYILKTRTP